MMVRLVDADALHDALMHEAARLNIEECWTIADLSGHYEALRLVNRAPTVCCADCRYVGRYQRSLELRCENPMRLCSWPATDGGCVELHHDDGRFWTKLAVWTELAGTGDATAAYVDRTDARWHYQYAAQNGGTLFVKWPGPDDDKDDDASA